MTTKIALVGIGKIAVDQHIPSIAASPDWELAATVSRSGSIDGVEAFTGIDEMLTARPDIPVVSLCLPPVPRYDYAVKALEAGRHVMLEKPPGATLSECGDLGRLAHEKRVALVATWHSREAAAVDAARDWLSTRTVTRAHITWHESVRKWHPGQEWIFEPGGMGVFDPGINALSILTKILPTPVHLTAATLGFPTNRQTPIFADLTFTQNVTASFDWRKDDGEVWEVEVETVDGTLHLKDGGARMMLDGAEQVLPEDAGEYPRLYEWMAVAVEAGAIEMDLAPMCHVADAFTLGARETLDAFDW